MKNYQIVLAILLIAVFSSKCTASKAEARLIKRLLQDYDKKVRAARLVTEPSWYDYRLRWNPAEYRNITRVIVPIKSIWRPDIILYNSANEDFDPTFKVNAETYSDGEIKWTPPGIFSSTCPLNIKVCKMKFTSWTYDMSQINLSLPMAEADIESYIPNGEWDLLGAPAVRNQQMFEGTTYVDLTYTVILARRPLYFLYSLVLPTVLVSIIAPLTFVLPVEASEKVTLCVTILLSICFFLLLVLDLLPASSDSIPLLGLYFAVSTILLSVSVAFTVFVLHLHCRTPASSILPKWVRIWVNGRLAFVLGMRKPVPEKDENLQRRPTVMVRHDMNIGQNVASHKSSATKVSTPSTARDVKWRMRQVVRELRTITKKMEKQDEDDDICEEWKFAASVIDRLCLWSFSLAIGTITIVMLFGAPDPNEQIQNI